MFINCIKFCLKFCKFNQLLYADTYVCVCINILFSWYHEVVFGVELIYRYLFHIKLETFLINGIWIYSRRRQLKCYENFNWNNYWNLMLWIQNICMFCKQTWWYRLFIVWGHTITIRSHVLIVKGQHFYDSILQDCVLTMNKIRLNSNDQSGVEISIW